MQVDAVLLLAINRISSLTSREKLLIYDIIDDRQSLQYLSRREIREICGRNASLKSWNSKESLRKAEEDLVCLNRQGTSFTTLADKDYPPQLREIFDPPFILFYHGILPDYNKPLVSIVGTRMAAGKSYKASFKTAYDLACCGIDTVSGLAKGVDSSAHSGCIAGRGSTAAVLGCGIDIIYPAENKKLAGDIIQSGGCILSEYAPGIPPLRYNFPARNRIISGLSRAVLVIQAPLKSGALITADYALEHGRDLMVHAAGLSGSAGEGTRKLAAMGAPVIDGAAGLLSEWGYSVPVTETVSVSEKKMDTGSRLSALLQEELSGRAVIHHGELFRRSCGV